MPAGGIARDIAVQFILRAGAGRVQHQADEPDRRAVHEDAVLRVAEAREMAWEEWASGEPEAGARADAGHGDRGDLPQAETEPGGEKRPQAPLPPP